MANKIVTLENLERYHDEISQIIDSKQDVISDLETIREGASKGAKALQSFTETDPIFSASVAANIKESDITNWNSKTSNTGTVTGIKMNGSTKGTSGVVDLGTVITEHQDISGKQDVISDLATIRSGAEKGATALQSVPSEYVTETELTAKGYATTTQLNAKQDTISDLGTIRTNASNGATAYGWGNHASAGYAKSSDMNSKANSSDLTSHTGNKSNPHGVTLSQLGVNASSAELNYLSGTTSNVQSQFNDLSAKLEKKAEADLYAKKSYVDMQISSALRGDGILPSYITKGSERIAENVLRTRNAYSFVMGAISDLHTTGNDGSASGIKNACLALNEINKLTQLDLIANLGDVMKGYMDDINDEGFKFVKQHMDSVSKSVPMLQLNGNHDDLSELSTEDAKQKAFAYIGANNLNVVTDFNNRFRNYGYRDFDDLRFRVIYLNTTDVTEFEVTENIRVSPEQLSWLVNSAVNFSNKTEPETWHFIVLSHVPLNALYESIEALQTILKAMVSKSSGSVTVEGTNISYNFISLAQKLVCHIHGHIHNFRTEWFDDLLSITVPNACFERNNEYGMLHESEVIRNIFGDTDKNGNQRQFNKTQSSGEDTAFNVFVIDSRVNNKIYAYNYGAGIHRTINLLTKEIIESSYESLGGEILPDGVYINAIPLSTEVGGVNIYNNGLGYKNETYISSSTGLDSSVSTHFATGVIPYSVTHNDMPDLYVFGVDFAVGGEDNYTRIAFFNSGGMVRYVSNSDIPNYFEVVKLADKYYKLKAQFRGTDKSDGVGVSNAFHNHGVIEGIRFSFPGTGEDVIISVRNSIVSNIFEGIIWTEYTNLVPTSLDKDGNPYNEGLGYKEGYRLSSSGGESSNGGSIISGFIPYNGEVIRAYGSTNFNPAATGYYINFYDSNHNLKLCCSATRVDSDPGVYFDEIDRRSVFTIDPSLVTATDLKSATTYPFIRVSLPTCGHYNFIVTLDEPLTINEEVGPDEE